jgi:hypothetical protein
LLKQDIPHEVPNAKPHEREAHLIERAGMPGAVTLLTNGKTINWRNQRFLFSQYSLHPAVKMGFQN